MTKGFSVSLIGNFVKLNTQSPNEKYYYRITKPIEQFMGVYSSDLAYFDQHDVILYVIPKGTKASYFPPFSSFENVKWICNGEIAVHIEYTRDNPRLCFLLLKEGLIYRVPFLGEETITELFLFVVNYDLNQMTDYLNNLLDAKVEKIDVEAQKRNFRRKIFARWYPR